MLTRVKGAERNQITCWGFLDHVRVRQPLGSTSRDTRSDLIYIKKGPCADSVRNTSKRLDLLRQVVLTAKRGNHSARYSVIMHVILRV